MPSSDADSPVGKLFYSHRDENNSGDVVVVDLQYSATKAITSLTLLTSTLDADGTSRLILQQFTHGEKPSTIELSLEAMQLLAREINIIGERRYKAVRRARQRA